jgi:hypothetical protein
MADIRESTTQQRFALRRRDFSHAGNEYLDGGWWPRSTDLAAEVDQLTADAAAVGFRVARLLYQLDEWTRPPRRVQVAGMQVKLGGYRYQPKDTITLIDDSGQTRLDLVVVPAGCDSATAARAMRIAETDHDADTSEAVLARARNG